MKKLMLVIALYTMGCLFSATLLVTRLYAAPGDIRLVLIIPKDDVAIFTEQFLAKLPIPMIEDPRWSSDPNNIGPAPMVPEYSAEGWAQEWLWQQLDRACWHGAQLLGSRKAVRRPGMIQKE